MAPRSLASLTLSFGLVSVPVKLYSATESKSGVGFNLMHKECGTRLKQQYVCRTHGKVVERGDMVKGYEFEKDKYVLFESSELDALEASASHTIDIVSFMPADAVDPIYMDKAYFLAPDKRGGKPYELLLQAMRESGTCALAKWVSRGKQHMVQVRAGHDGIVLQQLLYGDEVRSQTALDIDHPDIQPAELTLAQQLIDQYRVEAYDASAYSDEEKERILAAIDQKIAGNTITAAPDSQPIGGAVIDLVEALRASLQRRPLAAVKDRPARASATKTKEAMTNAPKARKGVRKAVPATASEVATSAPSRRTATKK